MLSSLKFLQDLTFEDTNDNLVTNEFPSDLVRCLPLLKSLTWRGFTPWTIEQHCGSLFGFELSKLSFLSQLHLIGFDDIKENWCHYSWPRTITDLSICGCHNLLPSSAHTIIHHIAPYLTKLRLDFSNWEGDESWEINDNWNSSIQFSLPYLIELELLTRNVRFLESFQECESLGYLKWTYITLNHCRCLNRMVMNATWPQLRKLDVFGRYDDLALHTLDPPSQALKDQLALLKKYCDNVNIKANITFPCTW